MNEELLLVPSSLIQAVHDYLTTRPMREVEGLVVGLRSAKPLTPPAPPTPPEPEPQSSTKE